MTKLPIQLSDNKPHKQSVFKLLGYLKNIFTRKEMHWQLPQSWLLLQLLKAFLRWESSHIWLH